MGELSTEQKLLISELKEDIDIYREEIKSQLNTTKTLGYIGLGLVVVVGILILWEPSFLKAIKDLSENMGVITSIIGEALPIALASKSYSSITNHKKKLSGLRAFEKELGRMEVGILPNKEENLLELESEFTRFITT